MSRRLWTVTLALAGGALPAVFVLVLAVRPAPAPAQSAPASPAAPSTTTEAPAPEMPPGYVGAEVCKGCHEDSFRKFETTKMGRLFLKHPRNTRERLACESCHGPGEAHASAGGGKARSDALTAGTSTCRSMRSSSGPEIFDW